MIWKNLRGLLALALASNLAVLAPGTLLAGQPGNGSQSSSNSPTTTPIKHVVVVISPWAKINFVDGTLTDQSSILRFIEDTWNLGRIGGGSYDVLAGSLLNMFNFDHEPIARKLILDPNTGEPVNDRDDFDRDAQSSILNGSLN
jgi:phospholipase C